MIGGPNHETTPKERTQLALRPLLDHTVAHAAEFLEGLPERRVAPTADAEKLRRALDGLLPEDSLEPRQVVAELARAAEPGLMATAGGRFFGFVIGGSLPAALAADWLTSAWDQNSGLYVAAPAASVIEEVCGAWLVELFGLPREVSYGFVTGCQMANFTALAAARHSVLEAAGWDVEADGLVGAPPIRVLAGEERHVTIDRAIRFLGLGTASVRLVPADGQGRMRADALRSAIAETSGPTIVCAQAGNVNTGAIDPLQDICDAAREVGAWVHVDGAFGMWAAATPRMRYLVAGIERADSWATDAHKWLNVPYDSGLVFCAHPAAHRAAMGTHASYLVHSEGSERDALDWNPEASRRARGIPVYAAIRSLGRTGVADLIDRCCAHARRFAEALAQEPTAEVLNEVVLNQVLVRFLDAGGDHDARTRAVVKAVQDDGTCWLGGTTWRGKAAMRISVSNWSTTTEDVDRSIEAILRAAASHPNPA
ncbi:MAG TPA: aminotransferase class V-fold PLP-dependent enzyme [Longimicrobiaceae bacterium]|nr:aminotransferase class V-fold PLP-dependent enzyme [Longimicrobiaceae bacterium]